VIESKSRSFESDLFSLGGIIYRMMKNRDRVLYLDAISGNLSATLKEELSNSYSESLVSVVNNLLSLKPEDRMKIGELLIKLENFE
jgi:serine/threonine protein kinase